MPPAVPTADDAPERLPERYEGAGLVLRRWTVDDVDLLAELVAPNLEHLRPWMPWVAFEPLARDARIELEHEWEAEWLAGGDVTLAITLATTGEPVGSTGFHRRRGPHGLEIGYWVDQRHLGQGIATRSTGVLTAAALGLPGIDFVEIHHDKANVASRRVPEKLGFVFTGEAPDEITAPGEMGLDCTWRVTRPWTPPNWSASPD